MDCQDWLPGPVRSVQLAPPSVEVKMLPTEKVAASFIPSAEEAIAVQKREPAEVRSVHVAPASLDV